MANHASLSKKQVGALSRHLKRTLPDSIDKLVEDVGADDAFTLVLMSERLEKRVKENKDA